MLRCLRETRTHTPPGGRCGLPQVLRDELRLCVGQVGVLARDDPGDGDGLDETTLLALQVRSLGELAGWRLEPQRG
jgi:hypothetical protein